MFYSERTRGSVPRSAEPRRSANSLLPPRGQDKAVHLATPCNALQKQPYSIPQLRDRIISDWFYENVCLLGL